MPYPSEKTKKLVSIQKSDFQPDNGHYERLKEEIIPDDASQKLIECHCKPIYSRNLDKDSRGDLENLILQDLASKPKAEPLVITHLGVMPNSAEMYIFIAKLINAGFRHIILHAVDLKNQKQELFFLKTLVSLWVSLYFISDKQETHIFQDSNSFTIRESLNDISETLYLELHIHQNSRIEYPKTQKPTVVLYEDIGDSDAIIYVNPAHVAENAKYYQINLTTQFPHWIAYQTVYKVKSKVWSLQKKIHIAEGDLNTNEVKTHSLSSK